MTVAYSIQRKIEDAVAGLAAVNSEILELAATVKTSYEMDKTVKALAVVVRCEPPVNANLAAAGGGAYWRAELRCECGASVAADKTLDSLDKLLGAAERFLKALTTSTLNTALTSAGITIHGITGTDQPPEEVDETRDRLLRSSAIMLHYSVS
jgi:hypothetical protein